MAAKPLVSLYKTSSEGWRYVCERCSGDGWDRTWQTTMTRADSHARTHDQAGFRPPKGA